MNRSLKSATALTRCLVLRLSSKQPLAFCHNGMQLLRSSIQISRGGNGKFIQSQQSSRFVSTSPNNRSTGGSKALIFGSVAVISIVGGTIGYASIDSEFRSYVEELLPGSKEAFDTIIGISEQSIRGIDAEKSVVVDAFKPSTNEIPEPDIPSIESVPQRKTEELSLGENEIAGNDKCTVPTNQSLPSEVHEPIVPLEAEMAVTIPATPPLPSTSHFPPSFEQVAPKASSKESEKETKDITCDTYKDDVQEVVPIKDVELQDITDIETSSNEKTEKEYKKPTINDPNEDKVEDFVPKNDKELENNYDAVKEEDVEQVKSLPSTEETSKVVAFQEETDVKIEITTKASEMIPTEEIFSSKQESNLPSNDDLEEEKPEQGVLESVQSLDLVVKREEINTNILEDEKVLEMAPVLTPEIENVILEKDLQLKIETTDEISLHNSIKEKLLLEIQSAVTSMHDLTIAAEEAGKSCEEAIKTHSGLVETVLEKAVIEDSDADDRTWKDVFQAANVKSERFEYAQSQIKEASSHIKKALEAVKAAKSFEDGIIASDPLISHSDELVNEALHKIQAVTEHLESATKDSKLVEAYRDIVEEGRQLFRREIASLLPDISPEGASVRKGPLTEDELDVFVTHAYRKVCRLQQELAKQTALTQQRHEKTLTDEQLRKQVITEEVVQVELDAQKRILEVEHQQKMAGIREEMENEIRSQLRRQAMAHYDHIKDTLDAKVSELTRKHSLEMEEEISKAQAAYQKEITLFSGRIEAIKNALRGRHDIQIRFESIRELWLACSSLKSILCVEVQLNNSISPLKFHLDTIKLANEKISSFFDDFDEQIIEFNEFLQEIIDSIPRQALDRGVYTDGTLRDRFFRVEKMAKRTALLKNENSSLLMYLLSYLQSLITISPSTEKLPDVDANIELDNLSNNDAITLAKGCVERGDITQAVRYMTLLKGEPAKISQDWIHEARLLLETRQACDALLAHAAVIGLETFPKK